ncbi:MAG TPA: hypothetical protein VD886_11100, partial [Herpetosiphonaceae bacterium]|nr:hypothetical protein [Herpetosiphonaceae bacterium]
MIDAAALDRVFDIHGGHVLLRDLTVRHGRIYSYDMSRSSQDSFVGAGILVRSAPASSLELVDSVLTDNALLTDHEWGTGGGINSSAPVIVSGSLIHANRASMGGGISSTGPVVIERSACRDNAGNVGGCVAAFGGLTITESLITGNSTYGGPPTDYEGGGIYAYGGENHISGSTISGHMYGGGILTAGDSWITDTLVSDNRIINNGGGGITNWGRLRLTGSAVVGNVDDYRYVSWGGGIFNRNGGELIVATSLISGNSAAQGGGLHNLGGAVLSDSAIIDNTALVAGNEGEELAGYGGGVYNFGAIRFTNVTISGNHAQGSGGGVANAPGNSPIVLDNSTVTANVANRAATEWLTAGDAGGVYAAGAPLSVTNSLIAGNTALSGVRPDAAGTLLSGGHTLIGNSAGVTLTGNLDGNLLDVPARLGPLSAEGGLPIHPLL